MAKAPAVAIADGDDTATGSKADAAWIAGDGTVISLLKKLAGVTPPNSPETGLAKDATLTGVFGSASDTPAAYTVLDQLVKLRKATEAELQAVQRLVALQTPPPPVKRTTTLLHRS